MEFFIDTANLEHIEETLKKGFVSGVTTNPSLMSKEPKSDFIKHIDKITIYADLILDHPLYYHLQHNK